MCVFILLAKMATIVDEPPPPPLLAIDESIVEQPLPDQGDNVEEDMDMAKKEENEEKPTNSMAEEQVEEEATEPSDTCEEDANFAAICSFFFTFGSPLGLTYGITELKNWLEDANYGKCHLQLHRISGL